MQMDNLIPVNGVHITEAQFPKGFYVAQYDAEGFTSDNRWFATMEQAATYAAAIQRITQ